MVELGSEQDRKPKLLVESWARCDEAVYALGMHELDKVVGKIGATTADGILDFLRDIAFVEDRRLARLGSEYFRAKFVLNDSETAGKVLSEAVKQYGPMQAICQLLWGRPGLRRSNVYNLLVSEEYIDKQYLDEEQLGSFLMLLNQCGIIRYSKKTNDITVSFNPRTGSIAKPSTRFLSPETPYSNLRNLWELIRSCSGFIHWFDKHFSAKGLEALHDEADGNKVKEIKILGGILGRGVNERLKRDFERFRNELETRSIRSEVRIVCDKDVLSTIHDRWIISEDVCFNVPPVDSMYQGQYSELKQTMNRPPFAEWWEKGFDLIEQWQEITRQMPEARV